MRIPLLSIAALGLAAQIGAAASRPAEPSRLAPPPRGPVPVAFLLSEGAQVIDFTGPWEVFQDALVPGRGDSMSAFKLYTVAESTRPIRTSGGMKVVPEYTFQNAPAPKVVVIPAQGEPTPATLKWLRRVAPSADVVMSVCTGAFLLAESGLLDGQAATTHHSAYRQFETQFPKVELKPGKRFVEGTKMSSAGGLTSGIDLALRVVERYFGRETAERTVYYMEYQSDGWRDATGGANAVYASGVLPKGTAVCPICMAEIPEGSFALTQGGITYSFCAPTCREEFIAKSKAAGASR